MKQNITPNEINFVDGWNKIQDKAHATAKAHGFWAYSAAVPAVMVLAGKLCLIHSEVSEGMEAIRDSIDGIGNLGEELADVVIRIMDISERYELNVVEELVKKMRVNEDREYMHRKRM